MYKKSITRTEKEIESSQAQLNEPALQDIIATNHVVFATKPRQERLSRLCKILIIMIILGLVAIGIIVLTLVLAHSRNTLMGIISRSAQENISSSANNSRILSINDENLTTTVTNDQTENENWTQTTTVILTTNNLDRLTSENDHISSSSIMRTSEQYEYISFNTHSQSMKPYPSLNTITNEQSTISTTTVQTTTTTMATTTISNEPTTFLPSSQDETSMVIMTTANSVVTTMESKEDIQTSSDNFMTSVLDNTSTLQQDETTTTTATTMMEETSFTNFISRHFNIQTSTMMDEIETTQTKSVKKLKNHLIDDDPIDDLIFL